jgi:hypothetical protein
MVDLLVYTNHRMGDMYYNNTRILYFIRRTHKQNQPRPRLRLLSLQPSATVSDRFKFKLLV